ncbi:MAG: hypothetical protein FWG94_04170 [Oscillospiraceae bacterium]|nr:hypothetical protein [Oscillospiraceae bacterium]
MVKLIVGSKGFGKTKILIDLVKKAAEVSKGNVICIERGDALKFGLSHHIRLIDIQEYSISGADGYYGFIAGLLAGDYDITDIFGDATFKILCGKDSKDFGALAQFVDKIDALTKNGPDVTFTVSCEPADLPESMQKYIVK